ncbi:MAG TPA: transposase [Allosphingosinicella sp.]
MKTFARARCNGLQSKSWTALRISVTDTHLSYTGLDQQFHSHHTVDHSRTFVHGVIFHTNFAESYHSLLKRGIIGAFHHVSDKHLPRYLAEFDRRWNTRKDRDGDRIVNVITTAIGKRLRYAEVISDSTRMADFSQKIGDSAF